jgi:hypothetical protein
MDKVNAYNDDTGRWAWPTKVAIQSNSPKTDCDIAFRVGNLSSFEYTTRKMLSNNANQTNETALMVQVGTNCGVDLAVLGALVEAGHSSIISLSGLHADFCVESPSAAAISAVLGAVTVTHTITVDTAMAQALRVFGGVLHTMLPAARQRMAEAAMVSIPGLAPVTATGPAQENKDDDTGHAKVAMRQWKMQKLAGNREHTKPRSNQISDKHVFKWHNDAFSHGRLVHFPGVMSITDAAHAKPDATRTLGNGMKITIDSETDVPADERSLVANCLSQAALYLDGQEAAWTFVISPSADGGPPGDAGYRSFTQANGSTVRQRFFAVDYKEIVLTRYTRASKDVQWWALPAIFDNIMIEIGNSMGSWEMVPDDAARFVCQQASMWTALGAGAKEPKKTGHPAGAGVKQGGQEGHEPKEQRPALLDGRCHAFDKFGSCPKGNMCPYRSNHNKLKQKVSFQRDHRGGDRNRNRDRGRDRDREYYDRPRNDDRRGQDYERGDRRY